MTTFFSVDIETTHSRLLPEASILTIGATAFHYEPGGRLNFGMALDNPFYVVVWSQNAVYWYNRHKKAPGQLEIDAPFDPSDSWDFWQLPENERAFAAATDHLVGEGAREYHTENQAAALLYEYVTQLEPDPSQRCFVANPVSFDKPFIERMFNRYNVTAQFGRSRLEDPFHYRSLCLRSMSFGQTRMQPWGSDRTNHEPEFRHHALSDAKAQAKDLVRLLRQRDHA